MWRSTTVRLWRLPLPYSTAAPNGPIKEFRELVRFRSAVAAAAEAVPIHHPTADSASRVFSIPEVLATSMANYLFSFATRQVRSRWQKSVMFPQDHQGNVLATFHHRILTTSKNILLLQQWQ
jgi:hypothetical protein